MRLGLFIPQYREWADARLAVSHRSRDQIKSGREAWHLAHTSDILDHAYAQGRDVTDGHIQTALERVFPNALFLDKKVY